VFRDTPTELEIWQIFCGNAAGMGIKLGIILQEGEVIAKNPVVPVPKNRESTAGDTHRYFT